MNTDVFQGLLNSADFMSREIVQHYDFTGAECFAQMLINPGKEHLAIDCPVHDQGRKRPVRTQAHQHRCCLPMPVRYGLDEALSTRGTSP